MCAVLNVQAARSRLLVRVEDVVFRLHSHMARVSAVCEAFLIGREFCACPHPPVFGNPLLSFSIAKACLKTSGTSTAKGASALPFGFN
jgi:hypothetical protein